MPDNGPLYVVRRGGQLELAAPRQSDADAERIGAAVRLLAGELTSTGDETVAVDLTPHGAPGWALIARRLPEEGEDVVGVVEPAAAAGPAPEPVPTVVATTAAPPGGYRPWGRKRTAAAVAVAVTALIAAVVLLLRPDERAATPAAGPSPTSAPPATVPATRAVAAPTTRPAPASTGPAGAAAAPAPADARPAPSTTAGAPASGAGAQPSPAAGPRAPATSRALAPVRSLVTHTVERTCRDGACGLKLRSAPSLTAAVTRVVLDGDQVQIACQATGDTVSNGRASSAIWDRLSDGSWASDFYLDTPEIGRFSPGIPRC
jgi:hypothetical protein